MEFVLLKVWWQNLIYLFFATKCNRVLPWSLSVAILVGLGTL